MPIKGVFKYEAQRQLLSSNQLIYYISHSCSVFSIRIGAKLMLYNECHKKVFLSSEKNKNKNKQTNKTKIKQNWYIPMKTHLDR